MAHILVVDDQTDICEVLKAGLETAPEFYVSCCNNGIDAIAILSEHQPEFLVVDVHIPGVASVDVAKYAFERKVLVLFMTGNPETADDLLKADVPCIVKPFRLDDLIVQVRQQLATRADNLRRIGGYLAPRRTRPERDKPA